MNDMNELNVSAAEDMSRAAGRSEAPGKRLAEARQAQNLSVADVARQLKLSVHQVEALEADAFERLPGSVFVRGFVRNYARLLKLDAEDLLRSVAECLPREEPRPAAPPSQDIPFPTGAPRRWPAYAALTLVVVAALAAYEFLLSEPQTVASPVAVPSPPTAQPAQPGALETPQPGAVPAVDAGQAAPKAEQPGAVAPDAGQGAVPGAAGIEVASTALATGAPREEEIPPAPGERQVRMVFDRKSWVEIRDRSGRPIFSQLNQPGTEQRVNGRPPLAVIVGNAHGVRLTYDERPVNLAPHTKVDVARLTLE